MTNPVSVGYVVGEVRTDAFTFVTNPDLSPPRLEYVVVRGVRERAGDVERTVDVLAQVASLSVNSRLLAVSMNYHEVEAILRRLGASPPVVVGQAKVLGYLDEGGTVRLPRGAAMPGAAVERAPDDLLARFFSQDVSSGIAIGTLINRPAVGVQLNPNGLRRHLAVIAQTGAGKSYSVGVVLEKLLGLGGTVVVFDPNSDYVLMGQTPEHRPTAFADRVEVFRVPSEQQRRFSDADIGAVRPLTVQFSRLEVEEICDVANISATFTNIRKAVQTAHDRLRRSGGDFTADDLYDTLEEIAATDGYGADGGGRRTAADVDPFGGFGDLGADAGRWLDDADGSAAPLPTTGDADAWFGAPEAAARTADDADAGGDGAGGGAARGPGAGGWSDGGREGDPGAGNDGGRAGRSGGGRGSGRGGGDRAPTPDAIAGASKALKYIEYLARLPIWGFEDLPLDDLLRPMHLAAIDLAGVDRKVSDFIVTKVVSEIWKRANREGLARPIFLVLEEAHNFVPAGGDEGQAGYWIRRIASEGRKFGVFLVLVTQRPYRVHQDTLSQCGSQIIMRLTNPEDQNAVRRASESISEGLLSDLPGLNVGEAVVLGPLVRVPVMVRVGARESAEGGSDVDVVRALEAARGEVVTDRHVQARREERRERGRTEWREEL